MLQLKTRWVVTWLLVFGLAGAGVDAASVALLTDGTQKSFEARNRASYGEETGLGDTAVDALLAFLRRPPGDDVVNADELATLKNNAADLLLKQSRVSPRLRVTLEEAFADPGQGEIWREYVVQKFPELALRLADAEQIEALAFLRARIDDPVYIYAGTALLGLQRLHEQPSTPIPAYEVAVAARKILAREGSAEANRITALQILALHAAPEARGRARELLAAESSAMMKVSALAVLGLTGEAADLSTVERYAQDRDLRVRRAAEAAKTKLEARR